MKLANMIQLTGSIYYNGSLPLLSRAPQIITFCGLFFTLKFKTTSQIPFRVFSTTDVRIISYDLFILYIYTLAIEA